MVVSNSTSGSDNVRIEMASYLGRGGIVAVAMSTLVAFVVVFIVQKSIPGPVVWSWFAAFVVLNFLRIVILRRYGGQIETAAAARRITQLTTSLVLLAGAFWGFAGGVFFPIDSPVTQVFLAFAIGGMAAGALATYSAYLPSVYAFLIPALLPITVRFFMLMNETSTAMGFLLVFFAMTLMLVAHTINRTMTQSALLRTENETLELDLSTSENRFQKSFDAAGVGMTITSLENTFLNVNPMICSMLGYTREEMLSLSVADITDPEDMPRTVSERTGLIDVSTGVQTTEKRYRRKDGSTMWGLLTRAIVRDKIGDPLYIIGQIQDLGRLKEMDRLKSEFVSTVSHELRTPLTSIQGALGLASSGALGDLGPELADALNIAKRNSDRLVELVNDILDFEGLDSGAMEFHYRNVDVFGLVRESIELNQPYARKFKIHYAVDPASVSRVVRGDADRLGQVITNLLSNAAKFSGEGSTVDIHIDADNDDCRVKVCDRGPGVPKEMTEKIFEPFFQVDGSDQRGVNGSGLGLSICQRIAEAHGGEISIAARDGGGAEFELKLPAVA